VDKNVDCNREHNISLVYARGRKKEIDTIPFVLLGLRLEQVVV
jgi:hypothetical protein